MSSRIPESVIEDVLARASIVDVVGEHVRLRRTGGRFVGLCPFHGEKTPSFSVNAERNFFHCFGCGASGSTIGFVMRHDGLSFPEAVRRLADRVGIVIPESEGEDPRQAAVRREKRDVYDEAAGLAQQFFRAALTSGRFEAPLEYLRSRGIDTETAEAFGIGYAPPEWSALVDALGRRGVTTAAMELAGLATQRRQGDGYVDRFRDRVMFPIVNLSRRVLAFSGRTLNPEERAKYVNSPETEFYTKGKELFGLHLAHRQIRSEGAAVVVEGNFDVVSLHAHGLSNVCAPLGTALTEHQARLLKRYSERVVLLFDGDSAGRAAARKALDALVSVGVAEVLFVDLPDGSDPDDIVRRDGIDALRRRIDEARPMLDVCLDEAVRPAVGRADIASKRPAIDAVAALLAPVSDSLIREKYLEQAAQRLEVDRSAIVERMGRGPSRAMLDEDAPFGSRDDEAGEVPVAPLDRYEAVLVQVLVARPDLLRSVYLEQIHHIVGHRQLREFLEECAVDWTENGGAGLRERLATMPEGGLQRALSAALVADHGIEPEAMDLVFDDTMRAMKIRWFRAEQKRLSEELRAAIDAEEQLLLMERVAELTRLMRSLQATIADAG